MMTKTEMNVVATIELELLVDMSLSDGVYTGETTSEQLIGEVARLVTNGDYVSFGITHVKVVGP